MPPCIGFSSIKTGITYPYSHYHIASGPSSPVSLLPAGVVFIVFSLILWGSLALLLLRVPFLSFSRVRLWLFSRRFLSHWMPLSHVFSVSRSFPSLSSLVFVRLSLAVGLCVITLRLFPSCLPSRYSMRGGGEAMSVPWCGCSFRGVALRGEGRFGWFFHMEL